MTIPSEVEYKSKPSGDLPAYLKPNWASCCASLPVWLIIPCKAFAASPVFVNVENLIGVEAPGCWVREACSLMFWAFNAAVSLSVCKLFCWVVTWFSISLLLVAKSCNAEIVCWALVTPASAFSFLIESICCWKLSLAFDNACSFCNWSWATLALYSDWIALNWSWTFCIPWTVWVLTLPCCLNASLPINSLAACAADEPPTPPNCLSSYITLLS